MNRFRQGLKAKLLFTWGVSLLIVGAAYGQDQTPATGEKKAKHVITEDDLASGRPMVGTSQANPTSSSGSQDDSGKKEDATSAADPAAIADADSADEERRKHLAGGPVPDESPKDAIKRLEREEDELRSKLDSLQKKADSETSASRREMWLEAIDRQRGTLQEMSAERAKLQKSEDEKAAAGESAPAESGTATAPQ